MDLIDRATVEKIIDDLLENDNLQASPSVWHGLHMIKQLPSAQPGLQPTCNQLATDCISRQAAVDAACDGADEWYGSRDKWRDKFITEYIEALPSAQPERKKGKWIKTDKHDIYYQPGYKCSACGVLTTCHGGYCPNCGADMRGEDHETD